MKIARKIGIVVSVQMGLVMGAVFTIISMVQNGNVVPIGIIISALISAVISGVLGGVISMKALAEGAARLFHINPAKHKLLYNFIEAIIGAIVFTPVLCTFFIIKNVGFDNPMFVKIWLSSLLLDFLVCIPLNFVFCPLFKKVAGKMFGISAIH